MLGEQGRAVGIIQVSEETSTLGNMIARYPPVSTGQQSTVPLYVLLPGKNPDERIRERDGTGQTWKTSSEVQREERD